VYYEIHVTTISEACSNIKWKRGKDYFLEIMFLYQFVNKIRGFFFAIMIRLSILEVLEKLSLRKKRLITKKILMLDRGTRTCFNKTGNYYYSN
jgi:hypothetical protein